MSRSHPRSFMTSSDVGGPKCHGGIAYKNLSSNIGKMSWNLESFQLRWVIEEPRLSPNGRRSVLSCLQIGPDESPLQQIVKRQQSYRPLDIWLCQTCLQKRPWVLSPTGPIFLTGERFDKLFGLKKNVGTIIIGYQGDFLAIPPVLLDS